MDGMTTTLFSLNRGAATERIVAQSVTGGYFALIGVRPELGRWLNPSDDCEGVAPVVVISHSLWQSAFAARPDMVGRRIKLDGQDYTLVGIMPATFVSITDDLYDGGDTQPEIWTPLAANAAKSSRNAGPLHVVGRLKPGVPIETAAAEMKTIAARLAAEYPADNENFTVRVGSMHGDLTEDIRPELYLLMTAVGFLLVISCLNIANLLLVRSTTRVAELSLRAALGADRSRIVAQLLAESASISLLGGAVGVVLAWIGLHVLPVLLPPGDIPWGMAKLNWPVLMVSVAVSLLAGIGFGLAPALRCSKLDLNEALKSGGNRAFSQSRNVLQRALVILQVALAFVLLSGATLLHKSLARLLMVNPGFEAANVLTLRTYLAGNNYDSEAKRRAFYDNLFTRISRISGVQAAGGILNLPMCGYRYTWDFEIDGNPKPKGVMNYADWQVATSEYFAVMHIPLEEGRLFSSADDEKGEMVAVVNRTMAAQNFPGETPVGKHIIDQYDPEHPIEVIGVVEDLKDGALDSSPTAAVYSAFNQLPTYDFYLTVRTTQSENAIMPEMLQTVHQVDAGLIADRPETMTERIDNSESAYLHRSASHIVSAFAVLALLLGAVGLYGVISYSVSQRTREIGVRMALGAQRHSVYRLILTEAGWLAVIGVTGGIVSSLGLTTFLRTMLFGVSPWDAQTLFTVICVLFAAALLASYLPARRAASVNPVEALRAE
jgi:predicted permease